MNRKGKKKPFSASLPEWMKLWEGLEVPTNLSTVQRDESCHMFRHDPDRARAIAEEIDDPWFLCQALSHFLRYDSLPEVTELATRCMTLGMSIGDPYQSVAVTAWPLSALVELGHRDLATTWLDEVIELSRSVEHPVWRLDALYLVWQAVFTLGESQREAVFEEFLAACGAANSWRASFTMKYAILIVARIDSERARELANSMPENWFKRRLIRQLAEGVSGRPRPFNWQAS